MKKFRSFIALMMVSVLIFSNVWAFESVNDYSTHWAKGEIEKFRELRYIEMDSIGNFNPDEAISRGEFVSIINHAYGFYGSENNVFNDVCVDDPYFSEIMAARENGYIDGYPGNVFKPDAPITREEVATILFRINQLIKSDETDLSTDFTDDSAISTWSREYVYEVIKLGFIKGYSVDNTVRPSNNITKAETVKLIDNIIGEVISETGEFGNKTYKGNVVISVENVMLKNAVIEGNLILGAGIADGDVTLENVEVKGTTLALGGGENSIILKDSKIGILIVNKKAGKLRIVAKGNTIVTNTLIKSESLMVEEELTEGSSGFFEVKIIEIESGASVFLDGEFGVLEIEDGIEDLILDLSAETIVKTVTVKAETTFTGKGTIEKASVLVENVKFDAEVKEVEKSDEVLSVIINDEVVKEDFVAQEEVVVVVVNKPRPKPTPVVENSTIETTATYDRYVGGDLSLVLDLNGNSLLSFGDMEKDVDYLIESNNLIIKEAYLNGLEISDHSIHADFSAGDDATVVLTIIDTTPPVVKNSSIQTAATYDRYVGGDLSLVLDLNGNSLLSFGGLVKDVDYLIESNNLIIKEAYLNGLEISDHSIHADFSAGDDATVVLTIIDTTPQTAPENSASLSYNEIDGSYQITINSGVVTSEENPALLDYSSEELDGDVYICANDNEYITLLNINILGNLYIEGNGSVTLNNVHVIFDEMDSNDCLKENSGNIIVNGVASNSLHFEGGVQANTLVVNDDDARIDLGSSTINDIEVTSNESGTIELVVGDDTHVGNLTVSTESVAITDETSETVDVTATIDFVQGNDVDLASIIVGDSTLGDVQLAVNSETEYLEKLEEINSLYISSNGVTSGVLYDYVNNRMRILIDNLAQMGITFIDEEGNEVLFELPSEYWAMNQWNRSGIAGGVLGAVRDIYNGVEKTIPVIYEAIMVHTLPSQLRELEVQKIYGRNIDHELSQIDMNNLTVGEIADDFFRLKDPANPISDYYNVEPYLSDSPFVQLIGDKFYLAKDFGMESGNVISVEFRVTDNEGIPEYLQTGISNTNISFEVTNIKDFGQDITFVDVVNTSEGPSIEIISENIDSSVFSFFIGDIEIAATAHSTYEIVDNKVLTIFEFSNDSLADSSTYELEVKFEGNDQQTHTYWKQFIAETRELEQIYISEFTRGVHDQNMIIDELKQQNGLYYLDMILVNAADPERFWIIPEGHNIREFNIHIFNVNNFGQVPILEFQFAQAVRESDRTVIQFPFTIQGMPVDGEFWLINMHQVFNNPYTFYNELYPDFDTQVQRIEITNNDFDDSMSEYALSVEGIQVTFDDNTTYSILDNDQVVTNAVITASVIDSTHLDVTIDGPLESGTYTFETTTTEGIFNDVFEVESWNALSDEFRFEEGPRVNTTFICRDELTNSYAIKTGMSGTIDMPEKGSIVDFGVYSVLENDCNCYDIDMTDADAIFVVEYNENNEVIGWEEFYIDSSLINDGMFEEYEMIQTTRYNNETNRIVETVDNDAEKIMLLNDSVSLQDVFNSIESTGNPNEYRVNIYDCENSILYSSISDGLDIIFIDSNFILKLEGPNGYIRSYNFVFPSDQIVEEVTLLLKNEQTVVESINYDCTLIVLNNTEVYKDDLLGALEVTSGSAISVIVENDSGFTVVEGNPLISQNMYIEVDGIDAIYGISIPWGDVALSLKSGQTIVGEINHANNVIDLLNDGTTANELLGALEYTPVQAELNVIVIDDSNNYTAVDGSAIIDETMIVELFISNGPYEMYSIALPQ